MSETIAKSKSKANIKNSSKSKPLADQVYDQLINLITSPQIPPGSRLSVDALVRELNVSQTPIRQALVRLQTQGLVVRELNVGYSTPPLPTSKELSDIFDLRLMIEPESAKIATQKATLSDIETLKKLSLDMEAICDEEGLGNYGKFAERDAQFHETILRLAGNNLALETVLRLNVHNHLFRLRFHQSITNDAIKEHTLILDAMIKKDSEKAKMAMKEHILASRRRLEPHF